MIIGVMGLIGSGKNTVADILIKQHGYKRHSFADKLKDATSVIFGWDRALLEGDTADSRLFRETKDEWWSKQLGYDVTPRLILQRMGTEAGRDILGQNIWVASATKNLTNSDNVVFSDCRFPNEIETIRRSGGKLLFVHRKVPDDHWFNVVCGEVLRIDGPIDENLSRIMRQHYPEIHESEWRWIPTFLSDYRDMFTIFNDGTIEDLENVVNDVIEFMSNNQ